MMHFFKEGWAPKGKSADREGIGHIPPNHELVIGIGEQFEKITQSRFSNYFMGPQFGLSSPRFCEGQQHQSEQQPRHPRPDKGVAPTPMRGDFSAQQVS